MKTLFILIMIALIGLLTGIKLNKKNSKIMKEDYKEKIKELQEECDHWYAMYKFVQEASYAEGQKIERRIRLLKEQLNDAIKKQNFIDFYDAFDEFMSDFGCPEPIEVEGKLNKDLKDIVEL